MERVSKPYMNPYLAGVLLGLVLTLSFYLTREGLGASGAFKAVAVTCVDAIAPAHTAGLEYYKEYISTHPNPMKSRLVLMLLGVLIGGFLSGLLSSRLKLQTERGPQITDKKRWLFAVIGGALFGIGAQFGRGCTSGAALSGMASMSAAGYLTMIFIFGTGYMVAYFFRKLWLKGTK